MTSLSKRPLELRGDLKRLKRDSDSGRPCQWQWQVHGLAQAVEPDRELMRCHRKPRPSPQVRRLQPLRSHPPHQAGARWRKSIPVIVGLAAMVALFLHHRTPRHENPSSFSQMTITPVTSTGNIHSVAISSDGKWLSYVADEKGTHAIWIRQLATGSTVQVEIGSPGGI